MKAISVRNISDEAYEAIKTLSDNNHRSMQEQVRMIIEREARLTKAPGTREARAWRMRLTGRTLGDTVDDVRKGRDR